MAIFGDPSRWLIVQRKGVWSVCPPSDARRAGVRGGIFHEGAQALAAFAACPPLRVDQLTEACRQYEWTDKSGDRWYYTDGDWCWATPFMASQTYCYDEDEVAKTYPWAGPFTRITGPGVPA